MLGLTAALIAVRFAAADAPTAPASVIGDLASLLEGEFTTAASGSEGASSPGRLPLYNLAKQVEVPSLGHYVVYAELREGTPDGHVLRQRLYSLAQDPSGTRITMTAYDLGDVPELAGAYADPRPLAKLSLPDLKAQPAGCEIIWHRLDNGFEGEALPGRCATMARLTISKEGMTQSGGTTGQDDQPTSFRRLR